MGLFTRKFKEPMRGTATVAGSTACPSHASSASCRMNLVVSLPGVPATPVEFSAMIRADKWPFPGTVLPIEVDLAKPSRMRILWDEVPSGRQRSQQVAQQIAAQMNGAGAPSAPGALPAAGSPAQHGMTLPAAVAIPPGARVVSSSVTINGNAASAEQIAAVESMTGMDLNGDGVIGTPPPA
jgi:hypothetical protein